MNNEPDMRQHFETDGSPARLQIDPDAERDAWHDVQNAERHHDWWLGVLAGESHRCSPDHPPCPQCQAREDRENEREFGRQ